MAIEQILVKAWYKGALWLALFRPVAWLFQFLVQRRRQQYILGRKVSKRFPVPVIVVGNITMGGTGKTPLVIHLVEQLRAAGFTPGVISRGYGGDAKEFPLLVNRSADVRLVGDEPHLIVQRTDAPMVIDPKRPAAAKHLLQHSDCDVIISDDGLQHYALTRDIEIVVVDGRWGFGNCRCLPEGPLREPLSRLQTIDFLVVNGENRWAPQSAAHTQALNHTRSSAYSMEILPIGFFEVTTLHPYLGPMLKTQIHAVAGIGNPQRFFTQLKQMGFDVTEHVFADHHDYKSSDFDFDDAETPIVMTEKDAVKCSAMGQPNWYFLKIDVAIDKQFVPTLIEKISSHPFFKQ